MYNRYIPMQDGSFRQTVVEVRPQQSTQVNPVSEQPPPPSPEQCSCAGNECCTVAGKGGCRQNGHPLKRLLPTNLDTGDLLILLILLLLLVDGDEDDTLSILMTLAAFILL